MSCSFVTNVPAFVADWRPIRYRPIADSTSVAGKARVREEGADDASASQVESNSTMSAARKTSPDEVCQGGICWWLFSSQPDGRRNAPREEEQTLAVKSSSKTGKMASKGTPASRIAWATQPGCASSL